jgi:hypothetical protein
MEVSHQLHAPAALLPGESPRYPLDGRLSGPQEPVWSLRRRDNDVNNVSLILYAQTDIYLHTYLRS